MNDAAANDLYEKAVNGTEDVEVVELHDCLHSNEIITYESLKLTEEMTIKPRKTPLGKC